MDPPDPWAEYLRRRGGFQVDDVLRARGAGRRDDVRAQFGQPGVATDFRDEGQSSRDFRNFGAGQWLNSPMPFQLPGSFGGAPIFGGPISGTPLGVSTGSPQGRPSLYGPPTFLATGAPLGTLGAGSGPGTREGGGMFGGCGFGSSCPTAFASTTPPTASRATAPGAREAAGGPTVQDRNAMSPGPSVSPGVHNAASAAASLEPPSRGQSPTVKVDSAFEVLGMTTPSSSSRPTDQAERFIAALTGEKRAIPTWQGSPGSLRTWLKLLAHWETETSVPKAKWGIRLYQSFQENSEPRKIADQVPLESVLTEDGYGLILSALMTKYKPYLDVAAPASIDRFFFAGDRQKNQTFANYLATKEISRQELESHLQEKIPDRIAARVLLRQAHLSDYQREMMALKDANQLFSWEQVVSMLRPLDRPELIAQAATAELGARASKHYPVLTLGNSGEDDGGHSRERGDDDEEEEEEMTDEEELTFEDREYDEHEAMYIRAYHTAYADVRRDLQNRRKERGFVRHSRSKDEPHGKGRGKRKPSRHSSFSRTSSSRFNKMIKGGHDDLLSRTRCYNCKELGHYARDCPLKGGGKAAQKGGASKPVNFVVCRGGSEQTVRHAFVISLPLLYATVKVRASEALVDTAAEDAVIGERAFEAMRGELAGYGLQPVAVSMTAASVPCAGIGGAAQTLGQADVPVCVGGLLGVLRFTILSDTDAFQTPPLLPISYLEAIDAVIDLPRGCLSLASGREAPIERLPSGHRAVDILSFQQTPWQLPSSLCAGGVDPFLLADAQHFLGVQPNSMGASAMKTTESSASSGPSTALGSSASSGPSTALVSSATNTALATSTFASAKKTTESSASSGPSTALATSTCASTKKTTESCVQGLGVRISPGPM